MRLGRDAKETLYAYKREQANKALEKKVDKDSSTKKAQDYTKEIRKQCRALIKKRYALREKRHELAKEESAIDNAIKKKCNEFSKKLSSGFHMSYWDDVTIHPPRIGDDFSGQVDDVVRGLVAELEVDLLTLKGKKAEERIAQFKKQAVLA